LNAQVDRLIALWQALHADSWVNKGTGTQSLHSGTGEHILLSRFVDQANDKLLASDLLPFWNGPTTFFDSDDARQWERLNYTYPEFTKIPVGTDPKAAIRAETQRLYLDDEDAVAEQVAPPPKPAPAPVAKPAPAPAAPVAKPAPAPAAPAAKPAPAPAAPTPTAKPAASPAAKPAGGSAPGGQPPAQVPVSAPGHGQPLDTDAFPITVHHDSLDSGRAHLDWFIRCRAASGGLDKSYTILFFFGDAPASEHDWRSSDNLVSFLSTFANSF